MNTERARDYCDGTQDHEELASRERARHNQDCHAVLTDGSRPCSCGYDLELAEELAAIEASARTELQLQRSWVVAQVLGQNVTWGELHDAFELVKPSENWKAAIDREVVIAGDREMEMVRAAVEFFTGSKATFEALGRNRYRVRAAGYYAAVGP